MSLFRADLHVHTEASPDGRSPLAAIARELSKFRVNVANMSLHRSDKGGNVMMIIETDDPVPDYIVELLDKQPGILQVIHYKREG